jgi:predicted DNA-binding transcriptional regulator AlpA
MPILIRKKPNNPPIDCDAVEERIRNGAVSISDQEHRALWQRDQKREIISRDTAAAMLGITVRTLLRRHHDKFGPERVTITPRRYGYRKTEVQSWVAEHGRGSHRPRSSREAPPTTSSTAPASVSSAKSGHEGSLVE